jgi:hypothetical protein
MTWTYVFDVSSCEYDGYDTICTETFLQPQKVTELMQALNTPKYSPHIANGNYVRVQEILGGLLIGERILSNADATDIITGVDNRIKKKVMARIRLDNTPHGATVEYLDTQYFGGAPEVFDTIAGLSYSDKLKLNYYKLYNKDIVYNMYVMRDGKMWYGRQHSLAEITSTPTFQRMIKSI